MKGLDTLSKATEAEKELLGNLLLVTNKVAAKYGSPHIFKVWINNGPGDLEVRKYLTFTFILKFLMTIKIEAKLY